MKQIYIASYFRNGYSRFMQFINNILDHPKREIIEHFIINYRSAHPGADKATITPALRAACFGQGINPVSESTVGRLIHDLKEKGQIAKAN